MGAFRQIIDKINETMADLSPSQRLVIGLCAVIIAGSFMWLMQWSITPEYVRLIQEPMTMDQLAVAREVLPEGKYRISGQYIMVSAEDRRDLVWKLHGADALPNDISVTFQSLIEDDSPFRPESENDFRRNVALQNELAKVIASSNLVKNAEVFVTREDRRRVGGANVRPSASIRVTMAGGNSLDQEMVKACAALVAGAVPGLVVHRVSVIDGVTLRTYTPPNPEDSFAEGILKETKKREDHLLEKVLVQLSYIPGVRVSVSVNLDTAKQRSVERVFNKPAVREDMTETTASTVGVPSGEPGVGPNVGQALTGSGFGSDTMERSTTQFQDQQIAQETSTIKAPFSVERATASIGIPRSYIVGILKAADPEIDVPSEEDVMRQLDSERGRIRGTVKNILMARNDEDVTVEIFHGMQPALTVLPDGTLAVTSQGSETGGVVTQAIQYVPEGGLVILAIISLFLMARTASQSSKIAEKMHQGHSGQEEEMRASEGALTVAAGPIGRVDPADDSMLEAVELDGGDLRANQIAEQVEKLVEQDAVGVAQLLQQWADTGNP